MFRRLAEMYREGDELTRIFEMLFSSEEARVFVLLPGTATDVARRAGVSEPDARAALEHGYSVGLLLRLSQDEYHLVHPRNLKESILGDVRNNAHGDDFMALWKTIAVRRLEAAARKGIGKSDRGRRVLPVPPDDEHVHELVVPFDDADRIVRDVGLRAVGQCSCRAGVKACDAPVTDICLAFDHSAEIFLERGSMREVSEKEAREIMLRGADAGLVHMSSGQFIDGAPTGVEFLCNCCTCCCNLLYPYLANRGSIPIIRPYVAAVDADGCDGCGECETRCLFDAVTVDAVARVDVELCVGCGQCARVCPAETISMALRPHTHEVEHTHEHWVGPMPPRGPMDPR